MASPPMSRNTDASTAENDPKASFWATIEPPHNTAASESAEAYDRLREGLEREILVKLGIPASAGLDDMVRELLAVQDAPETYCVYPEVGEALQRLRDAGYRLAIVSNFNWTLPELADAIGLGQHMDAVVTSARVGYRKPHRRIYEAEIGRAHV